MNETIKSIGKVIIKIILLILWFVMISIYSIVILIIPGKCDNCLKKFKFIRIVGFDDHQNILIHCIKCAKNREIKSDEDGSDIYE